jgi:hypothetical protein
MSGAIPPLPQYAFMVWCSVKAQGQLYLYFTQVYGEHGEDDYMLCRLEVECIIMDICESTEVVHCHAILPGYVITNFWLILTVVLLCMQIQSTPLPT